MYNSAEKFKQDRERPTFLSSLLLDFNIKQLKKIIKFEKYSNINRFEVKQLGIPCVYYQKGFRFMLHKFFLKNVKYDVMKAKVLAIGGDSKKSIAKRFVYFDFGFKRHFHFSVKFLFCLYGLNDRRNCMNLNYEVGVCSRVSEITELPESVQIGSYMRFLLLNFELDAPDDYFLLYPLTPYWFGYLVPFFNQVIENSSVKNVLSIFYTLMDFFFIFGYSFLLHNSNKVVFPTIPFDEFYENLIQRHVNQSQPIFAIQSYYLKIMTILQNQYTYSHAKMLNLNLNNFFYQRIYHINDSLNKLAFSSFYIATKDNLINDKFGFYKNNRFNRYFLQLTNFVHVKIAEFISYSKYWKKGSFTSSCFSLETWVIKLNKAYFSTSEKVLIEEILPTETYYKSLKSFKSISEHNLVATFYDLSTIWYNLNNRKSILKNNIFLPKVVSDIILPSSLSSYYSWLYTLLHITIKHLDLILSNNLPHFRIFFHLKNELTSFLYCLSQYDLNSWSSSFEARALFKIYYNWTVHFACSWNFFDHNFNSCLSFNEKQQLFFYGLHELSNITSSKRVEYYIKRKNNKNIL